MPSATPKGIAGDHGGRGQAEMGQHEWERELLFDDAPGFMAGRGPVPRNILPEQPARGGR